MNHFPNHNEDFTKIIKDSEINKLTLDYAEIFIDGLFNDGFLKDLPLFGTFIGAIKFGNSINKTISTKKIYKFLFELKDIPEETRRIKIDEINNSDKYQNKVGEIVLELLEQIESDKKPEIIGRLFAAYLEEKISFHNFLKATHIIKKIFIYDLIELKQYYDGEWVHCPVEDEIYSNGIVDVDYTISLEEAKETWDSIEPNDSDEKVTKGRNNRIENSEKKPTTKLTEIGKILITIGIK